MDWVDFNGGYYIETRLLEAQSKAPGARKQVDTYRSWQPKLLLSDISLPGCEGLVDRNFPRWSQKGNEPRFQPTSGFRLTLPNRQNPPPKVA